jgi:hypothetical protein
MKVGLVVCPGFTVLDVVEPFQFWLPRPFVATQG